MDVSSLFAAAPSQARELQSDANGVESTGDAVLANTQETAGQNAFQIILFMYILYKFICCCCRPAACDAHQLREEKEEEEKTKEEFFFCFSQKKVTQELLLLLHWIIYLMADLLHIAHVVEASQLLPAGQRTPAGINVFLQSF